MTRPSTVWRIAIDALRIYDHTMAADDVAAGGRRAGGQGMGRVERRIPPTVDKPIQGHASRDKTMNAHATESRRSEREVPHMGKLSDGIARVFNTCKADLLYSDGAEGMGVGYPDSCKR